MATIAIAGGDRDCSSAVISAYQAAGLDVEATYTGNMLDAFLATGKFEQWNCYDSVAQRGDIYLNYSAHTAMCVDDGSGSYGYDALAEFSINEFGGITGGEVGDQTGNESHICAFYDFPWHCTLHCTDRDLAERAAQVMEHLCNCPNHGYTQGGGRWGDGTTEYIDVSGSGASANPVNTGNVLYKLHTLGGGWLPWMCGTVDEGGSGDDFAGEAYASHDGLMVEGATYRVHTMGGGWLPWVSGCDENDSENGMAGIYGQAIDGIQVQGDISYRVQTASREGWLPWVTGYGDGDDGYAGIYGEAIDKLQMVYA